MTVSDTVKDDSLKQKSGNVMEPTRDARKVDDPSWDIDTARRIRKRSPEFRCPHVFTSRISVMPTCHTGMKISILVIDTWQPATRRPNHGSHNISESIIPCSYHRY